MVSAAVQLVLVRGAAHEVTAQVEQTRSRLTAPAASPAATVTPAGLRDLRADVGHLQASTRRLAVLTGGPPLSLASWAPVLGTEVRTARALTRDVDRLAREVLPVLADAAVELRTGPRSGPLDLGPVTRRRSALSDAARTVQVLRERTRGARPRTARLLQARDELAAGLDLLDTTLRPLQTLAAVGHGMTGGEGARRYVVLLQTPAEGRPTGGLVGGFVEVVVEDGAVRVVRQGSNTELHGSSSDVVTIPGYAEAWGSFGAQRGWSTANLSPDFPSVAKVWAALYREQFGVDVDGVVGATPQTLRHLLRGRPPVVLADGTSVTADTVVPLLERGVYDRFPAWEQEPVRNAYQQDLLHRLLQDVLSDADVGPATLRSVRRAVTDGSLRLASMHPAEQAELAATALSGRLPRGPGPFVAWTTSNVGGNKLDVFLSRRLSYRRHHAGAGRERAVATAVLRNDAPATGLPPYVVGARLPAGTNDVLLATYLTQDAVVTSVTVDGVVVTPLVRVEQGHPVVLVEVPLAPAGGQAQVVVTSEQPASDEPVRSVRQVMSRPDTLDVADGPPAHG